MPNNTKPFNGHSSGGSICNVPVMTDGTGTPLTSPVAQAATANIVVPASGFRFHVIPVGANGCTVQMRKVSTNQDGVVTVPANTHVWFDCAGMGGGADYPDKFQVIAGASSPVQWWFDCSEPLGA